MTKNTASIDTLNKVFKKQLGRALTDQEVKEIEDSLYYYARAKTRYLLIKKGVIKREK